MPVALDDREQRREGEFLADVGAAGAPDILEDDSRSISRVGYGRNGDRHTVPDGIAPICRFGRTARNDRNGCDEDGGMTKQWQV